MVLVIIILIKKGFNYGPPSYFGKPEVVTVSPSCESAIKIDNEAYKFAHNSLLKTVVFHSETVVSHQKPNFCGGCNILIVIPCRLKDFMEHGLIDFTKIKIPSVFFLSNCSAYFISNFTVNFTTIEFGLYR